MGGDGGEGEFTTSSETMKKKIRLTEKVKAAG